MIQTVSLWLTFAALSTAQAMSLPEFLQNLQSTPAYLRTLEEENTLRLTWMATQQSLWQVGGTSQLDQSGNLQATVEFSGHLLPWSQGQRNLLRQQNRIKLSLLKLQQERGELKIKAVGWYYRLGLLHQQLQLAEKQLAWKSQLYQAALQQNAMGNLKPAEVQQALMRKTEAEVQKLSISSEMQSVLLQANTSGNEVATFDALPEVPPAPNESDLLQGLQGQLAVQEADFAVQEAQWQLEDAQLKTLPEFQLSGSVTQGNISSQMVFDVHSGTLGGSLSFPALAAFDGWKVSARLRIPLLGPEHAERNLAQQKWIAAEASRRELHQSQMQVLRDELQKYTTLEQQLRLFTLTAQQADAAFQLALRRKGLGLVSEAEVMELDLGNQAAQLKTLETRTELYLQSLKLQTLTERTHP